MGLSDENALALRVFTPSTLLEPSLGFLQFLAWSEDDMVESLIEEKTLIGNFYKFSLDMADDKKDLKNKKSILSSTAKEIIKKLYTVGFLGYHKNYVQEINWKKIGNFYNLLKHIEKSDERKMKWAIYHYLENKQSKKTKNPMNDIQELVKELKISNLKKLSSKILKTHTGKAIATLQMMMDPDIPLPKSVRRNLIDDLEFTSRRSPGELDDDILELLDQGSYSNQELSILLDTSKALISKAMNRLKSSNEIVLSSHGTRGSHFYTTNCDNCPFAKDIVSCRYDAEKSIKNSLKTKFNFLISDDDLKPIETNQAVLKIKSILDNTEKQQPKMEQNINQNLDVLFASIMNNHTQNEISKSKGQAYVSLNGMLENMPILYILGFLHGQKYGMSFMDTFLGQALKDKIPKKERLKFEKDIVNEYNKVSSMFK